MRSFEKVRAGRETGEEGGGGKVLINLAKKNRRNNSQGYGGGEGGKGANLRDRLCCAKRVFLGTSHACQ